MPIKTTGPLSFSEIASEFKDAKPYSLSEFYRNGGKVPSGNTNVPTINNPIKFGNFYGAVNTVIMTYDVIGGGGGGGYGVDDGGTSTSSGRGGTGIASVISLDTAIGVAIASGAGGLGGYNRGGSVGGNGTPGAASFYGSGGAGGGLNNNGSAAPINNYGAGGGGGGGDTSKSGFPIFGWGSDAAGASGAGGNAGTRVTGTYEIAVGRTISIKIGSGGQGQKTNYQGADGAPGYISFTLSHKPGIVYTYSAETRLSSSFYTFVIPL